MIKQLFTICSFFLFATSVIGQNSNVIPFSNTPAKPNVPVHKTVLTLDDIHANYENGIVGERCLQHNVTEALMDRNPAYRQGVEDARQITNQIVRELESGTRAAPPVYTIPIVFHVIHKGEVVGSGTNISTAQIQSAVDALNRDFRRTSANGGVAQGAGPDTEIQFCLAGVDPNGNPHSGINRVNGTSVSGYSSGGISTNTNDVQVKALSRWDNRYYLNIWVVSEIDDNGADIANTNNFFGGTLGYAYIPQSPITAMSDIDGVVALNLCVGNDPNGSLGYRLWFATKLNRTLTHEVGHYLSLGHTFGNSCSESNCNTQNDRICDTPPTTQNSGCSSSCSGAQVENYMDYSDETCQDQFTAGQKTNMRAILTGVRSALTTTSNCGVSTNFDAAISAISTPSGSLCQTSFTPVVTLNNYGGTTLTSVQIQYFVDAQTPVTYNWTGSLASNSSVNVTLNSVTTTTGAHTFTARTVTNSLNGSNTDQVTSNNQSTTNFNVATGGNAVTLTLSVDCWGSEVDWDVRNSSNTIVASGGPYTNNAIGEQFIQSFCLAQGCYDFTIYDSQSDGMYGSQWQTCSVNGNYTISDGSTTLVQMTAQNADYGASATHNFCIGGGGGTTTTCEDLMAFDGQSFFVNNTDAPNFDAQLFDVDQQTLASALTTAGWNSEWMGFYEIVAPGDTNFFFRAASWFVNTTVPANNWLTFGPITMPSDGGTLTWNHRYGNNLYRDGYSVFLNTTGTAVANFTGATTLRTIADNAASTDGDTIWTAQSVSLPSNPYAFQSIYIGFRHTALDQLYLDLDDIIIEGCSSITVDISETEKFDLRVYPNPSSENFTFSYSSDAASKLDFRMLNSLGQEVWNYQTNAQTTGTHQIDTRGLSAGVYTLVVSGDRLNVSERLILTK